MDDAAVMTADDFLTARDTMPERGQWSELIAGRPFHFDAPDVDHGDVLGHLTNRINALIASGTPVFRAGLRVEHSPDTVRFPAVSFFDQPGRFDLIDREILDEPPVWVVEVASTPDRVRSIEARVAEYAAFGVKLLWVVEPSQQRVHEIGGEGVRVASGEDTLSAVPLADFSATVQELFRPPT